MSNPRSEDLARSYRAVRPPHTARSVARHLFLDVISAMTGVAHPLRILERPRVHMLYLHHVFPDEERGFRDQVEWVLKRHEPLRYSDAVARIVSGEIDAPYVAFSFDDGLESCVRAGSILAEYGVSACFFVCPGAMGPEAELTPARFSARLEMPPTPVMDWDQVESLRGQGHEIGGHTWSHVDLGKVPATTASEEIERTYVELRRRLGGDAVLHFAWPYGQIEHITPAAITEIFDAGFASCASVLRGCHVPGPPDDPRDICIRREHVLANWPLRHLRYFMTRSARRASRRGQGWPTALQGARQANIGFKDRI